VLQFAERVVMLEGRLVQTGKVDPFAEKGNQGVDRDRLCLAGLAGRPVRHAQALDWPVPPAPRAARRLSRLFGELPPAPPEGLFA
jgi:hypothetical protein